MSEQIQTMFASIAPRYDLTNDVLSLGMHRLWKHRAIAALNLKPGNHVLDLCTGTGDLAFIAATKVAPHGSVTGLDFVPQMVEIAKHKALQSSLPLNFITGDVMSLPFEGASFDAVTIAFGIRNVDEPLRGLKEIRRILKPGGRAVVLEFGQVEVPVLKQIYNFYSQKILPLLGSGLTGNKDAYEYLESSSRNFPAGENFLALLRQGGFNKVSADRLFGGIAYIYCAQVA